MVGPPPRPRSTMKRRLAEREEPPPKMGKLMILPLQLRSTMKRRIAEKAETTQQTERTQVPRSTMKRRRQVLEGSSTPSHPERTPQVDLGLLIPPPRKNRRVENGVGQGSSCLTTSWTFQMGREPGKTRRPGTPPAQQQPATTGKTQNRLPRSTQRRRKQTIDQAAPTETCTGSRAQGRGDLPESPLPRVGKSPNLRQDPEGSGGRALHTVATKVVDEANETKLN